jgi:hypothetical protein
VTTSESPLLYVFVILLFLAWLSLGGKTDLFALIFEAK